MAVLRSGSQHAVERGLLRLHRPLPLLGAGAAGGTRHVGGYGHLTSAAAQRPQLRGHLGPGETVVPKLVGKTSQCKRNICVEVARTVRVVWYASHVGPRCASPAVKLGGGGASRRGWEPAVHGPPAPAVPCPEPPGPWLPVPSLLRSGAQCGVGGCACVPPGKGERREWCQVTPAACNMEVAVTRFDFCVFVCVLLKPFISLLSPELRPAERLGFSCDLGGFLLACVC